MTKPKQIERPEGDAAEILETPIEDQSFQLDQALFYHTARISSALTRYFKSHSDLAEWAPDERRILLCLGLFGPMAAIRIADKTYMDRARVSRALPKLEKHDLVVRFADAGDKRRSIVKLTQKGADMHKALTAFLSEREAALFDGWDPAEREVLQGLLNKVYDRLQEMNE